MKRLLLYSYFFSALLGLEFDLSLGNAYNFSSGVFIHSQTGEGSSIHMKQSARTHGFKRPQYYSIRIRKSRYELEMLHHKLYFEENLADEISHFEVTDGYNLLMLNILSPINNESFHHSFYYRLGIGTVVAHPDITIGGNRYYKRGGGLVPKFWADGYHWGGVSSQGSLMFKKDINKNLSFHMETKFIYAITIISLEDDEYDWRVEIPNFSIHLLGGISFGK